MSPTRQTYPSITLRYAVDEGTGQPTWTLTVSDGENAAQLVSVSPETAAGIAETIDVALPTPIIVGTEATSAVRMVRFAHVQTLAAQLAVAETELRATAPARSTTAVPVNEAPPVPQPAVRPARQRAAAAKKPAVALVPAACGLAERVDLGDAVTVEPEAPTGQLVVEPPPCYEDAPEYLARPHLVVPPVDEF